MADELFLLTESEWKEFFNYGGGGILIFCAAFLQIMWLISVLAEDAIKAALNDYKIKNQADPPPQSSQASN